jgi:hypothetical protein
LQTPKPHFCSCLLAVWAHNTLNHESSRLWPIS